MTDQNLGEFGLIHRIPERFKTPRGVIQGIGDDAAVLALLSDRLLWTTDSLIEGVHFRIRWTSPYLLGRKALSVNLSDIAAMGGRPLFYTVSVALPITTTVQQWDDFYRGLRDVGEESGTVLVGGNTCHSRRTAITIGLLGEIPTKQPILRSGARVGDLIFLTGTVGDSALGLKLLQKGRSAKSGGPVAYLINRHLDPKARIQEGLTLAKRKIATAMIDVSDGLLQDLNHLCHASGVGAELDTETIPLSPAYAELIKRKLSLAMSGGEDYELLFTTRPRDEAKLHACFQRLGTRVTRIGVMIEKTKGIRLLGRRGTTVRYSGRGYDHFRAHCVHQQTRTRGSLSLDS